MVNELIYKDFNDINQNINDLIKRGKITPIKRSQKNTLFLKSDILKRNWQ